MFPEVIITHSEAAINELIAKQQIYDCMMRYSRGIDRRDVDALRSTFHPGAIIDQGKERTFEQFTDTFAAAGTRGRLMVHFIGNVVIELYGDAALVESYFVSYHTYAEDGTHYLRMRGGRYIDRFAERDGHWKIAHRVVADDWSNISTVTEPLDPAEVAHLGGIYPDDPVYKMQQEAIAASQAAR